jgi:hypothetical protein
LGFVFSAAGSGVVLVLVALAVVDDEVVLAEVTAAAVAPAEGAVWTPGAAEELPQPATAVARASSAPVIVSGLRMEVPEGSERSPRLCKKGRRLDG